MFKMRQKFMIALSQKFPAQKTDYPLDLSDKHNQQYARDIALRGVEEMFEALQHLKNWKPHRSTEVQDFDSEEFIEEIVDAFNYFFSLIIVAGFDADDLFDAYKKKDIIIHKRLRDDY
jgi:NTP pyrophosphatase (non-canonical NTP hydrolase)